MESLTSHNITVMFLALGILLCMARVLGEIAQRFHQPAVVGELLAGVLLGPTILGYFSPEFSMFLFPSQGPNAITLDAIATLSVVLFLLVAGIEVDLSTIWRQGKVGFKVGIVSIVIPFLFGFVMAWFLPRTLGQQINADRLLFSLFFATALSITALPVIAKTLMDMGLYRTDIGMIIVSAAIFNDLVGWMVFAIILGLMNTSPSHGNHIIVTITLTVGFSVTMLTLGRWLIHKTLPFLHSHSQWPDGALISFAITIALLGAALTEWIGIHAIFGSFIVGVIIGDSSNLREHTRTTIDHFVSFIFAPLFFASIGLKVNVLTHFDFQLMLTVLLLACTCKLAGGVLGARWGGMSPRESWAVGFAMNSRGAMEIILGLLALKAGIIRNRLFVALVIMAIITSMISGPVMRCILRQAKKKRLQDIVSPELFLPELKAVSRKEAIHEMTLAACKVVKIDQQILDASIWEREESLSTGIGKGLALPHARLNDLRKAVVAVGISRTGIDFDSPDDKLANLIFLILTPINDPSTQIEITSEIARIFREPQMVERFLRAKNFKDFLAIIKHFNNIKLKAS
ncbi:MAG: cation:proton antiporter [Desulfobacterales bacterium]|nr:cation:proton antiporter [Desulfobacterales bacterium]